jgi:hypothetical protein
MGCAVGSGAESLNKSAKSLVRGGSPPPLSRNGAPVKRSPTIPFPLDRRHALRRPATIPFPLARRVDLVQRLAEHMAARSPAAAEIYLRRQIGMHIAALHRRRVPDKIVEREIKALELAVRNQLFHAVLTTPGPKGAA